MYRDQEWSFSQHAAAAAAVAARAGAINNHGPTKGLIHDMILRKNGRPTSHLFDVRDAIASNRTSSDAAGAAANHGGGRVVRSTDWDGTSSGPPLSRTMSAAASTGVALGGSHHQSRGRVANLTSSSDPVVTSEALGSRLQVQHSNSFSITLTTARLINDLVTHDNVWLLLSWSCRRS